VEEFLEGEEISFLCLSDGTSVAPLAAAQDHKRIGEGDTGPNTGGMGVYSTDDLLDSAMRDWILHHIAEPTIRGMASEDTPFVGVLYCGLMMTARGPEVLEYNARFGDPEKQPTRPSCFVSSPISSMRWKRVLTATSPTIRCVGCRRLGLRCGQFGRVSRKLQSGYAISGLHPAAQIPGVQVFHAGSALVGGQIVTAGGRVLAFRLPAIRLSRLSAGLTMQWLKFSSRECTTGATLRIEP